ncbi:hypothetical protein EV189_1040 [Motilibacter rhizosphaerae]|uniref:Uncharacterized protein n=1 Tax=Motilibacter rhizosphaerae TaxID=598652 RepID=A0A4Q7NXR4_9ACTN|nr:hypothetical protein [Motilibacter rhizosphaerae]RZS91790.1 hypothetical protein EV189_1040 [Motilibacter rhizosphaerae]
MRSAEDHGLDALRLVLLVRLRRRLRLLALLALAGLPLCAGLVIAVQAWTPGGSRWWEFAGDWADPVLTALAAVLVLALLSQGLTRFLPGPEAEVAARLVPLVRLRNQGDARLWRRRVPAASALQAYLDPDTRLPPGLVLWCGGSVLFAAVMATQVAPAWEANHGHGEVVTIGVDAHLDHVEHGRSTTWFLSTPQGVVVSQSGAPHDGERFALTGSGAYAVGGHVWVLVALLLLAGVASALGSCALLVVGARSAPARLSWWAGRHLPAALDAARASGQSLQLVSGASWSLSFAGLRGAPAAAVLARRRRRLLLVVGVVLVIGGTATAVVQLLQPPPSRRDVTVPALVGLGLPDATASYDDTSAARDYYADLVGSRPASTWSFGAFGTVDGQRVYVDVDVFRERPEQRTTALRAVGDWLAERDASRPTADLPGLPAGAVGRLDLQDPPGAEAAGSAEGWLLWVHVSGSEGVRAEQLAPVATRALAALEQEGFARVARETGR